jgi:WXG100 family type VII secretion target
MSEPVVFDPEDIATRARTIQTTAGEIETQMAQLTNDMAAFADTYRGLGANAFQEVYAQWKQTQVQIKEELSEIGVALQNTGQARADVEGQIAGQWASAI